MEKCEICNGTTWIFYRNEEGYNMAKPCKCRERVIANRLFTSSGISEEDGKKGFNLFNTFNEQALINAKNTSISYVQNFKKIENNRINSIMLCRSSVRGKTTLGLAVANNLISSGVGVRYMPYRDEVTALKQQLADKNKYIYDDHIYRLKNARVLFIDDLLKGKINETDINILYEIINFRYLQRKPVIISTEKTLEQLLDFDEAIGSRLIEMSKGYIVVFDNNTPNYRLR